jgi:hypothetical protein
MMTHKFLQREVVLPIWTPVVVKDCYTMDDMVEIPLKLYVRRSQIDSEGRLPGGEYGSRFESRVINAVEKMMVELNHPPLET